MNEQIEDDNIATIVVSHRSPTFSQAEIKALVELIQKYKNIILNKCTNTSTNHAKEAVWVKISKEINKQGFTHTRNADCLKTKWENLKREARKPSKNLKKLDNEIISQVSSMLNETENIGLSEIPHELIEEVKVLQAEENQPKIWVDFDKDIENFSDEENAEKLGQNRSFNFSPHEMNLLLKCVKDEKKIVFANDRTVNTILRKNHAWNRIAHSFNQLSRQKRSAKMLRTKFNNMKRMARNVSFSTFITKKQHQKLDDCSKKKIKSEQTFDINDFNTDDDNDLEDGNDRFHNIHEISNDNCDELTDPLGTVLKGDPGIGDSVSHFGTCGQFEHKEVVKLKLELLKCQLETAQLERQRVIEATQADIAERESRAIETSLRLRNARLSAVAAELRLEPSHPALVYGPREARAHQYLQQFRNNTDKL